MDNNGGVIITLLAFLGVGTIAGLMWGVPQYRVYSERQTGMAELQRAESNRQQLAS